MERVALPGCFKRLLGGEGRVAKKKEIGGLSFLFNEMVTTFPHKSKKSLDQRPIIRPLIDLDELQTRIGLLKR